MAVVFTEGFDFYNGAGVNQGLGGRYPGAVSGSPSMVAGRFGGQAMRSSSSSEFFTTTLPASYTSCTVGFAMRANSISGNGYFFSFLSGSTYQFGLVALSDGRLQAGRPSSANTWTILGTSAVGVIVPGNWYYVEIEYTCSDTVGVVKVYVNSTLVIDLTNQDTKPSTPADFNLARFGWTGSTGGFSVDFDDIYATDGIGKIGECKIESLRPSADTAEKDWTPSTGTANYAMVDDTTCDGSTTYVQSSTTGDFDLYDLVDLSSTPTTVHSVRACGWAQKTDIGPRQVAFPIKSGAIQQDGPSFTVAQGWSYFERGLFVTDPNTGAAWTPAAVNALQIGAKVTT